MENGPEIDWENFYAGRFRAALAGSEALQGFLAEREALLREKRELEAKAARLDARVAEMSDDSEKEVSRLIEDPDAELFVRPRVAGQQRSLNLARQEIRERIREAEVALARLEKRIEPVARKAFQAVWLEEQAELDVVLRGVLERINAYSRAREHVTEEADVDLGFFYASGGARLGAWLLEKASRVPEPVVMRPLHKKTSGLDPRQTSFSTPDPKSVVGTHSGV